MISVRFRGKPFNITVSQSCAPTSNAEEAEVEWFYEDLQDLLELTLKKDVLFIIWDWNAKVGSQEASGVTGKFGLGVQNKQGKGQQSFAKRTHWSQQTPCSSNTREDSTHGHHQMVSTEIRLIIFFAVKDGEALYSQQKQDWELTVALIMNSLCQKQSKASIVAQLCPTLCDPMGCGLPGSSIHGIFQARILEWVALSFSRGSS